MCGIVCSVVLTSHIIFILKKTLLLLSAIFCVILLMFHKAFYFIPTFNGVNRDVAMHGRQK